MVKQTLIGDAGRIPLFIWRVEMVKMLGAEWKAFYLDPSIWALGCWFEEELLTVNGVDINSNWDLEQDVKDDDKIVLKGGAFYVTEDDEHPRNFEQVFKQWRKNQMCERFLVVVPKELVSLFKKSLEGIPDINIKKV